MANSDSNLVVTSVKLPREMHDYLEKYTAENGYASASEVIREALRERLYRNIEQMRGALKGKVPPSKETMGKFRRRTWHEALKKAGGDYKKASDLLDAQERKAIAGLKL